MCPFEPDLAQPSISFGLVAFGLEFSPDLSLGHVQASLAQPEAKGPAQGFMGYEWAKIKYISCNNCKCSGLELGFLSPNPPKPIVCNEPCLRPLKAQP